VLITLQPLLPLPPYVRSSRETPDKVLLILSSDGGGCFYITSSSSMCSFFFCFGGGRPLHKVQSLILCISLEIPNAHFKNSSLKAFLSSSSDVLSILRRNSRLIPELFIRSLPRSCCFRPRSLMPFLHSKPFQRLITDVRPFGVLSATLSWSYLLRSCPLHCATFARCIISLHVRPIPSMIHDLPGSEFS
jgi:hypothetical protein